MATDPTNVTRRKHKLELHNRRIQWDTPIAKWAGEANDWIQVVTRGPLRKEDVTVRLLKTMRHAAGKRKDKKSGLPTKKPRDPDPLILEEPAKNKKFILQMRGDSKTIVDWVNGHAKLKTKEDTIASPQSIKWDWWGRRVDVRQRVADWAIHIFRVHSKEADSWAVNGVKSREEEWVDTANVFGPKLPACVFSGTVVAKTARADRSRSFGTLALRGLRSCLCGCLRDSLPRWRFAHRARSRAFVNLSTITPYSPRFFFVCSSVEIKSRIRCVSLEVSPHEVLFLSWSEPCAFSLAPCFSDLVASAHYWR